MIIDILEDRVGLAFFRDVVKVGHDVVVDFVEALLADAGEEGFVGVVFRFAGGRSGFGVFEGAAVGGCAGAGAHFAGVAGGFEAAGPDEIFLASFDFDFSFFLEFH